VKYAAIELALAWVFAAAPVLTQGVHASLVAAHRGGALLWPENSLLAFRNAVGLGADFLEFDVHLSKDGEVIVIHDATLDRTTTGTGPVRGRTLAELRMLRLKERGGAVTDEPIPTLDDVVVVAAGGKRRMLLEIKPDDRRQRYPGIEEKVVAILDRHGVTGSTVVMAFERETWRRIRELRPDIAAGALYSPGMLRSMRTTLQKEFESARMAGVRVIGLHQDLVDASTVATARQNAMTLGVWTVNEAGALRRLIDLGAPIVITDRPDLAKQLVDR